MRSNVVLPQPEGPISAMNSPDAISRSTGRSAQLSPNRRDTPRIEIAAISARSSMRTRGGDVFVGHHLGDRHRIGDLVAVLEERDHLFPIRRVHPKEAMLLGFGALQQRVLQLEAPGELFCVLRLTRKAGEDLHGLI